MRVHNDSRSRFKVRKDQARNGKQFVVLFNKRFVNQVDPAGVNPTLRKAKLFIDKDSAVEWGQKIARQAESYGTLNLPLDIQTQMLGLAAHYKRLGGDPVDLLNEAVNIHKHDLDALKALKEGVAIVKLKDDYLEDDLGKYIEKYSLDPKKSQQYTHKQTVSALKTTYKGLEKIKLKAFCNEDTAINALTPVIQTYLDKPEVKRLESLKALKARLRQLLVFVKINTGVPNNETLNFITDINNYPDLRFDLLDPKENYAFSAAEILVLIKFFCQKESFCPTYPIISALMGSRLSQYLRLNWEMFGGKGRNQDSVIKIPKELLKTVKQKKTNRGLRFKVEAIPNLEIWLWFSIYLEEKVCFKRDPRLPEGSLRTMSKRKLERLRNQCLLEWSEFFECSIEENDEYRWGNAALNAFRNAFLTYGMQHSIVHKSCSTIANDQKSHAHYKDLGSAEPELEASVLFELNPTFLALVDLENKTVDTEFLYGDKEQRLKIISEMDDGSDSKKLEYECIMQSLEDPTEGCSKEEVAQSMNEELLMNPFSDRLMNEKFFSNVLSNKLFWMGWYEEIYSDRQR